MALKSLLPGGLLALLLVVVVVLLVAAGAQPQLPTITAVEPSRFPVLTETPFSLTVSLGWSAAGNIGEPPCLPHADCI